MLSTWLLFALSTGYVALLFAVAYVGDRNARIGGPPARKPWVYALALCVYCTSWTFYGAVGRAASDGWNFLPIYVGPALVFMFAGPLLRRIVRISKRHNITSIADFIGARYGRHQPIAMLVAFIAIVGVVPYIALQLKAISFGFNVLTGSANAPFDAGSSLAVAVMLAAFAILFGTRELVSTENHHGMVLAIAFESIVKLATFLAVGVYVAYGLHGGLADAYEYAALTMPSLARGIGDTLWQFDFLTQTLLAAIAVVCLPRQFHVTVVENAAESDLKTSRWVFPLYMAVVSVFVLPIAATGLATFPAAAKSADTFVLALPLHAERFWLALGAYLGGFSAATGMVIVETIALSTMVCNEVVMPILLRSTRLAGRDVSALIKMIRRVAIVSIIGLAYAYFRLFTGPGTLAEIGLLSFAAVAQFAPGLIGGMLWRGAGFGGVGAGLVVGFAVWIYTLLLPVTLRAIGHSPDFVEHGPMGIGWLRPESLFGMSTLDPLSHGVLWSLLLNGMAYVGISLLKAPGLHERLQATKFLEDPVVAGSMQQGLHGGSATVSDLQKLLEPFLGREKATAALRDYSAEKQQPPPDPRARVDGDLARFVEHVLAGILGTSSARLVLRKTLRGKDVSAEDVVRLLDETSHAIQFSRELLRAALEHLPQGLSVVDANLNLVAWNRSYQALFQYPPGMLTVGRSIEELLRYNANRRLLQSGDVEVAIARRLSYMRAGMDYVHEREIAGGIVLEIRGNAMPGGGFVTSYSDVSGYKRAQRALLEANETLENRVLQRTRDLTTLNEALNEAKMVAERTNAAKSRFLASATHDLVQPITAARLFISAVHRRSLKEPNASLVARAEAALLAGENLIGGLLGISRLDAGGHAASIESFPLMQIVEPLVAEFGVLAQNRGIELRTANCHHVVRSDRHLLRRMLQNLLSNAVRYTRRGKVLVGCRRRKDMLSIEVWDTGRGIPEDKQKEIFEEFRRLDYGDGDDDQERGLGLGLAIVERIARLLTHPISMSSSPGRGSAFSILVPIGDADETVQPSPLSMDIDQCVLAGRRVLCLENEPAVLAGIQALLASWGCEILVAHDRESALDVPASGHPPPDIMIVDYHLDRGQNGLEVAAEMQAVWGVQVPGIVLTADHTKAAQLAARGPGYQVLHKPLKPAALRALINKLLLGEPTPHS